MVELTKNALISSKEGYSLSFYEIPIQDIGYANASIMGNTLKNLLIRYFFCIGLKKDFIYEFMMEACYTDLDSDAPFANHLREERCWSYKFFWDASSSEIVVRTMLDGVEVSPYSIFIESLAEYSNERT